MNEPPVATDLRQAPRRPFGVYMLVILLLVGVFAATLEIIRAQAYLVGFWADADEFLRDHSGLVALGELLSNDANLITVINGIVVALWVMMIIGLWLLQRWAWLLLMISTGATLTFALVRYFNGNPDYISMLVNVAVAFYLNDNSVQRAFARRNSGGGE